LSPSAEQYDFADGLPAALERPTLVASRQRSSAHVREAKTAAEDWLARGGKAVPIKVDM
jgi:hypothetical protein